MPYIVRTHKATINKAENQFINALQTLLKEIPIRDEAHLFDQITKIIRHHDKQNMERTTPLLFQFKVILNHNVISLFRIYKVKDQENTESTALITISEKQVEKEANEFIIIKK